jgi:hypothetical protein
MLWAILIVEAGNGMCGGRIEDGGNERRQSAVGTSDKGSTRSTRRALERDLRSRSGQGDIPTNAANRLRGLHVVPHDLRWLELAVVS